MLTPSLATTLLIRLSRMPDVPAGEAYPRLLYFSAIGQQWSGVHDSFHQGSTHSDNDWLNNAVPPLADGDVVGIRQDASSGRIELYRNRALVYTTPHAFPLNTLHLYGALAFENESFTILEGAEALEFHAPTAAAAEDEAAAAADAIEITNEYVWFDTDQVGCWMRERVRDATFASYALGASHPNRPLFPSRTELAIGAARASGHDLIRLSTQRAR